MLFRAKDVERGVWRLGAYKEHRSVTPSPVVEKGEEIDHKIKHFIIESGSSDWGMPRPLDVYEVDKETVGRDTGKRDRNNRRIFEGDWIRFVDSVDGFEEMCDGEVVFCKEDGMWGITGAVKDNCLYHYDSEMMEVVGNIHDGEVRR